MKLTPMLNLKTAVDDLVVGAAVTPNQAKSLFSVRRLTFQLALHVGLADEPTPIIYAPITTRLTPSGEFAAQVFTRVLTDDLSPGIASLRVIDLGSVNAVYWWRLDDREVIDRLRTRWPVNRDAARRALTRLAVDLIGP